MPCVYILKSLRYPKTYVGSTLNLTRRLQEHNQNQSLFTKRYVPWKVIYKEEMTDISEARKREKYFKSLIGRRLIKKILNNN